MAMNALLPCPRCGRHIRATEPGCVFCGLRGPAWIAAAGACLLGGTAMTGCIDKPGTPAADAGQSVSRPGERVDPQPVEVYGPPPRPIDAGR